MVGWLAGWRQSNGMCMARGHGARGAGRGREGVGDGTGGYRAQRNTRNTDASEARREGRGREGRGGAASMSRRWAERLVRFEMERREGKGGGMQTGKA